MKTAAYVTKSISAAANDRFETADTHPNVRGQTIGKYCEKLLRAVILRVPLVDRQPLAPSAHESHNILLHIFASIN